MRYDPVTNNFTTFESVETPKVEIEDPVFGKWEADFADRILDNGTIIAKSTKVPGMIVNNPEPSDDYEAKEEANDVKTSSPKKVKESLLKNKKQAMEFFMSKGLAPHLAAGLVGNLIRESGLNPHALNKSGGAFGIALWLGRRKTNLISKYGKNPTFELLLEYVWEELNTTHKMGLQTLLRSKDATEAAANAFGWFEFSVGPQGAIREMNKYGQAGLKSYDLGIKFANDLLEDVEK